MDEDTFNLDEYVSQQDRYNDDALDLFDEDDMPLSNDDYGDRW